MIVQIKQVFTSFETSRFWQSFDTRKSFLAAMKIILDQFKVEFFLKCRLAACLPYATHAQQSNF